MKKVLNVKNSVILAIFSFLFSTSLFAQVDFEKIKNDPQQLLIFLQNMPKGGDLHIHHGGAAMAEDLIRYAQGQSFCLDPITYRVNINAVCPSAYLLDSISQSGYDAIINHWSMRNFYPNTESNHDHFFNAFMKFQPITTQHAGEILAGIVQRAESQQVLYLELMITPDHNESGLLGKQIPWNNDFSIMRKALLARGMSAIVSHISTELDKDEVMLKKMHSPVTVRYLYQVFRLQPPTQVFAQLLAGFEAASRDPRILGINMVMAEDDVIAMRDYKLQMNMVKFLHQLYPKVHITLHAGELNSTLVPFEGLRSHIRDAIEIGQAERIGHGVSVAYENNADQLLKEMAKKHILVETSLVSNAKILGVQGDNHPLPLYMHYNIPIALSSDDEGILRTSLTEQYQKAILTYHVSYSTVKTWVRNSIAYSFLPGKSLWQDYAYQSIVSACAKDKLNSGSLSVSCTAFLKTNEKAALQWALEKQFWVFEKQMNKI